jgi:glycosyltransferase involved in cell wall biosynthesis
MSTSLSVVMPVYNEAAHLSETIEALVAAVESSDFHTELVLVDDGSTDGSSEIARTALAGRLPLRLVSQPNRGRYEARRAGIEAARGEYVLLLDGRVRLHRGSLDFTCDRVEAGERVWNGHVRMDTSGNPYGAFWNVLVELAWSDYFSNPRTTSFDSESFDRYPKGTTCFLAPRHLIFEALGLSWSRYVDSRHANDDTPLIRWIAGRERIHISPSFSCEYLPRSSFRSFVGHSVHRGTVFLDGHGRTESRFYPLVIAFFPLSAATTVAALRRPALVPALALVGAAAAAGLAARARRSRFETASFGVLAPVYALAHGAGMWRGLALLARRRLTALAP